MQRLMIVLAAVLGTLLAAWALADSSKSHAAFGTVTVQIKDSDGDGCNDAEESHFPVGLGLLDPANPLDFPDVNGDRRINSIDMMLVGFRWPSWVGSFLYHERYDLIGPEGLGPDGKIDILDLQFVASRFGISCQGSMTVQVNLDAEGCNNVSTLGSGGLAGVSEDLATVDCTLVYDEDGDVVEFIKREFTFVSSVEELTEEEAAEAGYVAPTEEEAKEAGLISEGDGGAAGLQPWYTWTCRVHGSWLNVFRREVFRIDLVQRFTTTPYTNIDWPPPEGSATESSAWGWSVGRDARVDDTYPLRYYLFPDIVAVGETHASARFDFRVSFLGIQATLRTYTAHLYLKFQYPTAEKSRCQTSYSPH